MNPRALILALAIVGCSEGLRLAPVAAPDSGVAESESASEGAAEVSPGATVSDAGAGGDVLAVTTLLPYPPPDAVPAEGCRCGEELAQACDDGLCVLYSVCSICREPEIVPTSGGLGWSRY